MHNVSSWFLFQFSGDINRCGFEISRKNGFTVNCMESAYKDYESESHFFIPLLKIDLERQDERIKIL